MHIDADFVHFLCWYHVLLRSCDLHFAGVVLLETSSADEDARSRESSTTPSLELSQPDEAEEDNRQNRDTIVDENGDEMQNMTRTDAEDNGEDNDEPEEAPRVSPSRLGCINPHVYLNTRL